MKSVIPGAATVAVLVALAQMPYGYYMLLRLGLCVACVYYVSQPGPASVVGHRIALWGLAVLYNPVVPVHLRSKPLWTMVNIATVAYFCLLESQRPSSIRDYRAAEVDRR
jgi:hypothetical protein